MYDVIKLSYISVREEQALKAFSSRTEIRMRLGISFKSPTEQFETYEIYDGKLNFKYDIC